ncbi:hypothetical protein JR316_0013015 [Psilocybe cubensis]|uniref:Uncharacterized protein n=1 Tax=Psilocybe cubensis TaxID=181762 RepID=A0ACB8GG73_PSICU|nr:hypothetical protein JR316_0013015 [Psilocybe cubensis]KAH9474553.1 hypothetical protein JR316_0013015 [Psilocybe cubensis]
MAKITDLPTETLLEVASHLEAGIHLAHLALTCHRFVDILMPQVLDTMAIHLEEATFQKSIKISPPIDHQISREPRRDIFIRSYGKIEVYVHKTTLEQMRSVRCLICRAKEIRDVELFVAESSRGTNLRNLIEGMGTCIGRRHLRLRVTTVPRKSGITVRIFQPNVVPSQITASTEPTTTIHITSSVTFTTLARVTNPLQIMQPANIDNQSTQPSQSDSVQAPSNVIEASSAVIGTRRNSRLWSFPLPSFFRRRTTRSPSSQNSSTTSQTAASPSNVLFTSASDLPPSAAAGISSGIMPSPTTHPTSSAREIPIEIRNNTSGVAMKGHASNVFYAGVQRDPIFYHNSFPKPLVSSLFIDGDTPFHHAVYSAVTQNALRSGITNLSIHRMSFPPSRWTHILPTIALPALKTLTIGNLAIAFEDLTTFLQRHNTIETLILIDNQPIDTAANLPSINGSFLTNLTSLTANPDYIVSFLRGKKPGGLSSLGRLCILSHGNEHHYLSMRSIYHLLSTDNFSELVLVLDDLGTSCLLEWLLSPESGAKQEDGASDCLRGVKTLILNMDDVKWVSRELVITLNNWVNGSSSADGVLAVGNPPIKGVKSWDVRENTETLIWTKCRRLEALKLGRKLRTRPRERREA